MENPINITPHTLTPTDTDKNIELSILATILENSKDVIYIFNYQTQKIDFISPASLEITGYSADEIMNMGKIALDTVIHSDFKQLYISHFNNLLISANNPNRYYSIEYKIRPKEGISRWLSDSHKILKDAYGNIIKIVGNIRDVTDFKLVEDALKRSRDRLYKAIEATNDGMWDWKLDSNKLYFDERFYTMAGYLPHEFAPTIAEWMNRVHPQDLILFKKAIEELLANNSDQLQLEYRFKTKTNEWIWVLNRAKTFERNESGNPVRMVGTHTDISLRVQINLELENRNEELEILYKQLHINEEKFRQLAENTHDAFWLADKEMLLYMNPPFEKMWASNAADVLKNPSIIEKWIHPEDKQFFKPLLDLTMIDHMPHVEQFRIIKSDGEVRWIWSRRFPVFDKNNELYRIAGIATDITDQKNIEEALVSAKEKAMESDRLKSAFLANISHEIRTPMNGILGFTSLLNDDSISHETRNQFIHLITKSGEQLLHIIDDIIDISKIESNQIQLKKTDFYLKDLMSELYNQFDDTRKQTGKESINFFTTVDPLHRDIQLYTDYARLKQIFMNLLSNAFKFTTSGYIQFGYTLDDNNMIEFFVEDTGIGIPMEFQATIFQRFRQADESSTRNYGGTGIGLAICKGLAKLLGGELWLKSEKSNGSTLYFNIPYQHTTQPVQKIHKNAITNTTFDWSGITILLVEDDEINQEFLLAILEPTNATLILVASGEDAIESILKNKTIDLVLMDIRLPQMNGFEAFEKIHEINPAIPVIAQTAFAMTDDTNHCIELGFASYISKPIDRLNLLTIINRIICQNSSLLK